MTETAIETAERNMKAYLTFRRGLRRLRDAETIIIEALALLERRDHLLGPITEPKVNETTAEREGFTPAQIMQMEQHLNGEKA